MKITKARLKQIIKEEYETMMGSDIENISDEDVLGTDTPQYETDDPVMKLMDKLAARIKLDRMSPEELDALAGGDMEVRALIDKIMGSELYSPQAVNDLAAMFKK
tara:strand:+ start:964 stop:1278 length:315 start_codon:yes stop_codon:yes gene_type:complete